MKHAFCTAGCGKSFMVPDDAEHVTCFTCDERAAREADAGRFVSASCEGEPCNMCGSPAEHKIAEVILPDDPTPARHEFTAYVCHDCFADIMGAAVT
jgi:hypothetical protein